MDGVVCFDKNAYIYYRQHTANTAGAPNNIKKRIKKEWKAFRRDKKAEAKIAQVILDGWADEISTKNRDVLKLVAALGSNVNSKLRILLSGDFTTGDFRLTLLEKIKILFA